MSAEIRRNPEIFEGEKKTTRNKLVTTEGNKSALKCNELVKVERKQQETPVRNSSPLDIQNHSVNKDKPAIIMKKKKSKCINNSLQPKAVVKCDWKPLCDSIISNLDSEMLNLTADDACQFRRKNFETSENLKHHDCDVQKSESTIQTYDCKYCSLTFTQRNHFNKHVVGHKRNNCTVCKAQFAKRKALCKHLRVEHNIVEPERLYRCTFCDEQFTKKTCLAEHLKVHADGQHVCLRCGFMSDCKNIYEQHLNKHIRDSKYKCQLCEKKFVRHQQFIQHMVGHDKHSCSSCDVTFSTKKSLVKHRRSVHGARVVLVKKYACPICKKLFVRPKQLQLHQRIHTGERPVKCSYCEKSFSNGRNLSRHMKSVRHLQHVGVCEGKVIEMEKPFQCSECGVRFFRESSLFRHSEQIHSVRESLKCPHCEYSTKYATNLKRHLESHTDTKRFICEMCGLSFRALATLKEHHAFVHSENRSFPCSVCKKSFKNKSTLQRHLKVHSETRPFKCHCNKDYKRLSHLKRHMTSCHRMPFKKNHIPNIYEGANQDTSSNEDAALVENHLASNNFPLFATCRDLGNVVMTENSNKLLLDVSVKEIQYTEVPTPTLPDKNGVHSLHGSDPESSLVTLISTKLSSPPPAINLQTDSLDDPNLNLSPSNFCNFNLPSSPLVMENVTSPTLEDSIVPQDMLSFSSPVNNSLNDPHPSLQNQPSSSMEPFANFSLHHPDSSVAMSIPSLLLGGGDMSSPTHINDLQHSASKHFFGDSDDILSLSHYASNAGFGGANCPSDQLFNSSRDIELWDNSGRLKLSGVEFMEGACSNNNFSTQANNLNLLFSSDSFHCSLDANALNSDFDSLSNLC